MHDLTLKQRLVVALVYSAVLIILSGLISSEWLPGDGTSSLWVVSGIGLWSFLLLDAPRFVAPVQGLATAVASGLLILAADPSATSPTPKSLIALQWSGAILSLVVGLAALAAIYFYGGGRPPVTGPRPLATAQPANPAGRLSSIGQFAYRLLSNAETTAALLFTPAAILSIFGFHAESLDELLLLTLTWFGLAFVRPIETCLRARRRPEAQVEAVVGQLARIDHPNLVRVRCWEYSVWTSSSKVAIHMPDGAWRWVLPTGLQTLGHDIIGTGLVGGTLSDPPTGRALGCVVRLEGTTLDGSEEDRGFGESPDGIVGFAIEGTSIDLLRFEVTQADAIQRGDVVAVSDSRGKVLYQVTDARIGEETFENNPGGKQLVEAPQLGRVSADGTFTSDRWLPAMNTPVVSLAGDESGARLESASEGQLALGHVPRTRFGIALDIEQAAEFHAAILGVTGTGKTELALSTIAAAVSAGFKVLVVDVTDEYARRLELAGLDPVRLAPGSEFMDKLEKLSLAGETGKYGGAEDRGALEEWVESHREEIEAPLVGFLEKDGGAVGVFDLSDIANTRGSLRATDLFVGALLSWAKVNRRRRRILLVLEEAHTIVPEQNIFRGDKGPSASAAMRIGQVALQGRKYGVGLLLLSQRTALVSKTLLSQCGTYICLAMYDRTALEYFNDIFGEKYARMLPHLGFLEGVAFGKALSSDGPVLFKMPEDEAKKAMSQRLDWVADDASLGEPLEGTSQGPAVSPLTEDHIGDVGGEEL